MILSRQSLVYALLAALAAPSLAQPQPSVNRPFAARRVVYQFDFEPDPREVFELPRYWDLAQDGSRWAGSRPGFPAWNTGGFDDTMAFAGSRSVRLSTKGGSVCLRLEPGVIPVFPGTDYLVSARLHTRGLKHARAHLVARYLDKANAPIPGASARSELVAQTADGQWTLVTATLPGSFPGAAYIQIDLELLQPEQFAHAEHDKHQVWSQDFAGSAWFDQVAVVQLPRAAIATASPINILRAPERPKVSVMLRDLTGEQITGTFTLQDAAGRTIDEMTRNLGGAAGSWDWEPKVQNFGWYRATLELRTGERRVGATYVDLAWLPAAQGSGGEHSSRTAAGSSDGAKFSAILRSLPGDGRTVLPELLDALGGGVGRGNGAVTIPVWSQRTTPADIDKLCHELIPLMERLHGSQRRVTFSLPRLPETLAAEARLESSKPLWVFAADEKMWGPYLIPLLDKYGQSVQRWQVGPISGKLTSVDTIPAAAARISAMLSRLVPGPIIELPWPGDQARASFSGADVELLAAVPPGVSGAGLADFAAMWAAPDKSPAPTLVLGELAEEFSRLDSCISMVKQAVQLWGGATKEGAEPPTLAIVEPWEWSGPSDGPPMPRAEFAAWANLSERLRDRRAVGRLEPQAGVSCIILAPAPHAPSSRTGALAMWSDGADTGDAFMDVYLGEGPVEVVDIFGNRRSIALTPIAGAGGVGKTAKVPMTHRLPISDSPVFVENVDVDLARFAASFKLDPAFAATSASEHEIGMILSNPWKTRIEGRITVIEPGGLSVDLASRDRSWRITPRSSSFSIGPGENARVPLTVAFSSVEEAGPKDFLVEIELAGTRDYAPVRLHTTLEIGVNDVHLDLAYRIVNGTDVAIEAQVTNRGKAGSSSNYELSGFADQFPRAKAFISDLPVGAVATRRFSFPGGAATLKGLRVSVGVQDVSTQSRVTRSVLIE